MRADLSASHLFKEQISMRSADVYTFLDCQQ